MPNKLSPEELERRKAIIRENPRAYKDELIDDLVQSDSDALIDVYRVAADSWGSFPSSPGDEGPRSVRFPRQPPRSNNSDNSPNLRYSDDCAGRKSTKSLKIKSKKALKRKSNKALKRKSKKALKRKNKPLKRKSKKTKG
ncbi:hypothetical protein 162275542 [Organic Lake phycodnavirus]|jgi:hypothetical protein|nr:hypothetical protein 162275542 [Organic Lake phycodnavirus]